MAMQAFINQLPQMLIEQANRLQQPMMLSEVLILFNQQAIVHLNISEEKMRFLTELLNNRTPGYIHDLYPILTRLLEEVSDKSNSANLRRSLIRKGIIPDGINYMNNSNNEEFQVSEPIFTNNEICIRRADNGRNAYMATRTMLIIALSTLYGNTNYAKYFAYEREVYDIYIQTYIR